LTCENCIKDQELAVMSQKLLVLERDSQRHEATHKEIFSRLEEISEAKVRTEVQYTNILTKLEKVESAVDELKGKPAKRWESVVASALQWLVVAVMAALIVLK
jgi:hypothetical protein